MVSTVILATVQRWFPDRTGFASGVVVTANGLCGFLAPLSRKLLEAEGVQKTLLIVGVAITISWILCGIFFQAPDKSLVNAGGSAEKSGTPEMKQYSSGEMMRTEFLSSSCDHVLWTDFLFYGFTGIPDLPDQPSNPVCSGSQCRYAWIHVNAGARLVLPTLADKVGRIVCIKGVLIVAVIAMGVLAVSRSLAVTVAVVLMYGCYGGIMGSFPSLTSSIFGMKHTEKIMDLLCSVSYSQPLAHRQSPVW